MKTLHLTLMKEWFDQILAGTKKIEYREIKPYWTKRLFDDGGKAKKFDIIEFRNGYSKDCRKMRVEFKGLRIKVLKEDVGDFKKGMRVYGIKLGDILK